MTQGLGVDAALYTHVPLYAQPEIGGHRATLEQVLPRWRIDRRRGHPLGQRLACPRSCPPGRSSSLLLVLAFAAGCGGGDKDAGDDQRQPVVGQGGDDEKAGASLGFPGFATKNTTRVGGADPVADAAGVAQAIFPARSRDTRPASVTLVDAKDWRAAISAAQLMSRPLRSPILLSDGEDLPDATKSALDELGAHRRREGRQRPGHPRRQDGEARGRAHHRPRGRRPGRARPGDRPPPHRGGRGAEPRGGRRALERARSSRCPPPAGRRRPATRCCGATATRSPPPPRPPSPRTGARASTCSGPPSVISDAVRQGARRARDDAPHLRRGARRERDRLRALHRRALRLERGRPRPRARVREHHAPRRRRRGRAALGRGHLRAAAARHRGQRAAAPAAGVPARRPARLRRRPRARGLQPRLDHRRREGDLGRRPVAHRRAARDPARAARPRA